MYQFCTYSMPLYLNTTWLQCTQGSFKKMRNCISKQKILQVLLQVCKPSKHVLCFPIKNLWLYFLSVDNLLLCGNIFQWIALLLSSLSFLQQASMLMFSIHNFLGRYMPKLSWNISFILIALDLTVDWVKMVLSRLRIRFEPVWQNDCCVRFLSQSDI